MSTKTRAELVTEALQNLGAIGTGQAAEDDDEDFVDSKVDSLLSQLRVDQICDVSDEDEIPDEWFDSLGQLLANNCATKFGQPFDPAKKMMHESFLRRLTAARATYEPLRTTYY